MPIVLSQYCMGNWSKIDAITLWIFNGHFIFIAMISLNIRVANQVRAEEICSSGICSVFSDQDWDVHID